MTTKNNNEWLSRDECSAMRAIAILAIMLHNYCHWLKIAVQENEYQFFETNSYRLLTALTHPDGTLPVQLVSYFGHYGVPVFLFLSGFGLTLKYERTTAPLPATGFLWHHYRKLFTMMITGLAVFTVVDNITRGTRQYLAENIIAQMTMVINFLPEPDRIIWPGPYWFFGLMMQLYIIWRLLIFRRHWSFIAVIVGLCCVAQALCEPEGELLNRLRYNSVGGVMPFCAGVILGRMQPARWLDTTDRWQWAVVCVLATTVLTLCCFSYLTWFAVPLFVIIATVAAVKALPGVVLRPLAWTGTLSAVIFVIHPVFRKIFIPISHRGDIYDGLLLYIIATVVTAWMVKTCMNNNQRNISGRK